MSQDNVMDSIDSYQFNVVYKFRDDFFKDPVACALGIAGEAGELCEVVKKEGRDKEWAWSEKSREALKKELGDVLICATYLATAMGWKMSDVLAANMEKMEGRLRRGTIKGNGDDR